MIIFLKIMIGFWASGIVISILSKCYVSAILCSIFLMNTISELYSEIERAELLKSIEWQQEFIDKCSDLLKDKK